MNFVKIETLQQSRNLTAEDLIYPGTNRLLISRFLAKVYSPWGQMMRRLAARCVSPLGAHFMTQKSAVSLCFVPLLLSVSLLSLCLRTVSLG